MPTCQKIVDVRLDTGGGAETLVNAGVVQDPHKIRRITVNSFLASGGDGFSVLLAGTSPLGGAQDLDALIAYMGAFKSPHPPYDPALAGPRLTRLDAGSTCP